MSWRQSFASRSVAVISVAAIGAIVYFARSSELLAAAIVIVAMAWGAAPQAIDAFLGRWSPAGPPAQVHGSVTIVVHVDAEPAEISRTSVLAAAASAPTVVVATDAHAVEMLGPLAVPVFVDSSLDRAVHRAAETIETDAMLMLSARSFADTEAAEVAAGLIRQGAGWIIGSCPTFNSDGFAPMGRDRLARRLRSSARSAGLQLWETNATVVSTQLVRDRSFKPGAPWGATLRSWAADGVSGADFEQTLAMTAEPVDAKSYWPASLQRRRGSVADLADAVRTSRGRPRWLAIGLLLRELYGYPMTLWLLTPWLLTRTAVFPFRCPSWVVLVLCVVPPALRWGVGRHAHGLRGHPLEDLLELAFDAPGSVLALPAALSRRVTRTRLPVPGHPLMVAGLAFAAITIVPLFTDGTTAHRSTAVGLALTELAMLWLLAMRAVFQRNWVRTTYRIRARLPLRVDGAAATTLDVSPAGLASAGDFGTMTVGSDVSVDISLDDGSVLVATGTVADHRLRGDADVAGIALRVPPEEESRWIAQLSRSASQATTAATAPLQRLQTTHPAPLPRGSLAARLVDRLIVALIVAATLATTLALCLALVGYRPLIVRSGSMEPALNVGDVVFVEDVEVDQLVVGDIATISQGAHSSIGTLTHRVRAITANGQLLIVTTRGDANATGETFTMAPHASVGRVTWRVPRVGASVAWAGVTSVRWIAAAIGVCIAIITALRLRRRVSIR